MYRDYLIIIYPQKDIKSVFFFYAMEICPHFEITIDVG